MNYKYYKKLCRKITIDVFDDYEVEYYIKASDFEVNQIEGLWEGLLEYPANVIHTIPYDECISKEYMLNSLENCIVRLNKSDIKYYVIDAILKDNKLVELLTDRHNFVILGEN